MFVLSFYRIVSQDQYLIKCNFFAVLQLTYRISATRQYTNLVKNYNWQILTEQKFFFFVIKINIFLALILSGIFLEPVFVELFTGSCSQDRFRMYVPTCMYRVFFFQLEYESEMPTNNYRDFLDNLFVRLFGVEN